MCRVSIVILFTINFLFFTHISQAQVEGCTDPLASNYNPFSINNDGSCIYNAISISPDFTFYLESELQEISGLIIWNDQLWAHNDNDDINIYTLDTINGKIFQSYPLRGVNINWEEISQDSDYIYIGDFGNNLNGNRTDLKILKVYKNSLVDNSPVIDTIHFSYSDQNNFNPAGSNNTDFDCEAFIVTSDSIFLFTKQWVSNKTGLYSLSKTPGIQIAKLVSTLDVQGLITGAVYLESKRLIVLCGYSNLLEPYVYLLYGFHGSDYFNGNKRRISLSLPYHQIEGVTTKDGLKYYLSNEFFTYSGITVLQKLHIFDLSSFLGEYLATILLTVPKSKAENVVFIYPNPTTGLIRIKSVEDFSDISTIEVYDYYGKSVFLKHGYNSDIHEINLSGLSKGIYFLRILIAGIYYYHKVVLQ